MRGSGTAGGRVGVGGVACAAGPGRPVSPGGVPEHRRGSMQRREDSARRTLLAAGILLLSALLASGCGSGDPAEPLPPSVTELLRPVGLRAERVADGVWYREIRSPVGPWVIHLLEADLERCEVGLAVLPGRRDGWGPLVRVTEMLRGEDGEGEAEVLAAVNGDFFTREGRPIGPEVVEGRLRARGPRPVLSWRAGEGAWIGRPSFEGDSVADIGWPMSLAEPDGGTHAVGGFPELLKGGRRVGDLQVSERPDFAAARHPRTAVALDPGGDRLWLVVVDGRQEGWSAGMTLPELTALLEALGVEDALNLDGGGSSVMIVRGRRVSRPSDAGGERAVVNALALRRDWRYCQLGGGGQAEGPPEDGEGEIRHPAQDGQ